MDNFRQNIPVRVRFLLGPAGSGKTFQCLEQVRGTLRASPEGPPLVFLAPKQATFQIERQLLSHDSLPGYTRLRILSFERFASFALQELGVPPPKLLPEDGRVMVLRALLSQKRTSLGIYHATARLPGLADQLSTLFRELQQSRITAPHLRKVAESAGANSVLARKLSDIALLLESYADWLKAHGLQDGSSLLDLAAGALVSFRHSTAALQLGGFWLDGFAEMTAQELDLLAAALPFTPQATLAFCLEQEPVEEPSWLSTWAVVAQTYRRCRARLSALADAELVVEQLERDATRSRFSASRELASIEQHWTQPVHGDAENEARHSSSSVRILACANPEHEAVAAAREILRHVRGGGRYREVAVLMRSLDGYGDAVRRVFHRYGIPFFLDRREPVAHHPLAELTRFALRTVAFQWQHDDWFGVLKTGLLDAAWSDIDLLENHALANGWEGDRWFQPFSLSNPDLAQRLECLRTKLLPPFTALGAALGSGSVTGDRLATGLRHLWSDVGVSERLEEWSERSIAISGTTPAAHVTVSEQMDAWANHLVLAFAHEALPLRDWLPIVESGLSGLTVGVIPPALDQVLVGTIDRSRNPDLKLAIVPGLNESVFPAPPSRPVLLTESEREQLAREDAVLGPALRRRLGHERYYGYIAFTRARERLVATYSKANHSGDMLQPSGFVRHLRRIVPDLTVEDAPIEIAPAEAEHFTELLAPILKNDCNDAPAESLNRFANFAPIVAPLAKWRDIRRAPAQQLSAAAVQRLYPAHLPISVSALEEFAACPFKFFVSRGLGAKEREEFEPDARHRGEFQHELLAKFHEHVAASGRRWRDLSPVEARAIVKTIGESLVAGFRNGVFAVDAASRITAGVLVENAQTLAAALVHWAQHYAFDPSAVELGFGLTDSPLPAWTLDLGGGRALVLRGRIDRVDLWRDDRGRARAVVMDYKSRSRQLDAVKLHHGLELQLLSYLGVLRNVAELREHFDVCELEPAGVFYINLAARRSSARSRHEADSLPYQHLGRFDGDALELFDTRAEPLAEQFRFARNKDGNFSKKGNEALARGEFLALMQMVEDQLREHGRRIFDGVVAIDPYRKGREKACERCDYAAICRFDSWTQNYRVLRRPRPAANGPEAA